MMLNALYHCPVIKSWAASGSVRWTLEKGQVTEDSHKNTFYNNLFLNLDLRRVTNVSE